MAKMFVQGHTASKPETWDANIGPSGFRDNACYHCSSAVVGMWVLSGRGRG